MDRVEPPAFRCGRAARWLPRVLAAAVLVAALLAAFRFDPESALEQSKLLRNLVAVLGGGLALWIVKTGAEVSRRSGYRISMGPRTSSRVRALLGSTEPGGTIVDTTSFTAPRPLWVGQT